MDESSESERLDFLQIPLLIIAWISAEFAHRLSAPVMSRHFWKLVNTLLHSIYTNGPSAGTIFGAVGLYVISVFILAGLVIYNFMTRPEQTNSLSILKWLIMVVLTICSIALFAQALWLFAAGMIISIAIFLIAKTVFGGESSQRGMR